MTTRILASIAIAMLVLGPGSYAQSPDPRVLAAETKRVAAIEKVRPTVVAVFAAGGAGDGGGSGVLVSDDGYALTNYHVVAGAGNVMRCGLADGVLYDAVLVGLDKVGDVALIKLLPKVEGKKFPFAVLGDSDKVKAGDWALAMGNPFLLATDFTPTVTYGLVSGVHRYQYPAGTLLEYTDCIQIDTSINPGNSGGPLFNVDGELIGINGRGSFEKRGRVNSGVGYAISINQIKNFLGHLRAGLDTDHASLGAVVESESEERALSKMMVKSLLSNCDAARRGLDIGDQLVSFAGRPMGSVNHFKNVLGLYPKGWRMPLVFRRENEKREILVRLMGVMRTDLATGRPAEGPAPRPGPGGRPATPKAAPTTPASKFYEAKAGFANYYFNKLERDRLVAAFKKHGDFDSLKGDWSLRATGVIKGKKALVHVTVKDRGAADGKSDVVQGIIDGIDYSLEPLKTDQETAALKDPPGSGGLLVALYQYRQLLAFGEKGFVGEYSHGGVEPFYPPGPEKSQTDYAKLRVDCEVLRTKLGGATGKWYFSLKDQTLLGAEITIDRDDDPCELYFADYEKVDGRSLPRKITVRYGDKEYAVLAVNDWKVSAAK